MRISSAGITLIELLIAIVLFSVIILTLDSVNLFTNWQVISSDRRAKLQNEVSLALEHMAKEISKAIGNTIIAVQIPVSITTIQGDYAIRARIDFSGDARFDPFPIDREIAYRFTAASGNLGDRYQIWYYSSCVGANCNQAGSTAPEVISRHIVSFVSGVTDNYVNVGITACWDPATPPDLTANPGGTADNPCVTMRNFIQMPAVSAN